MYHYTWLQNLVEMGLGDVLHGLGMDHAQAVIFLHAWLATFIVVGLALVARKGLDAVRAQGGTLQFVPDATLTPRNFFELVTQGFGDLVAGMLGKKDGRIFWGILSGMFVYILVCNLMGLVPGFTAPTGSFQMNFGMAVTSLAMFTWAGLKWNGSHFIKHLMGPVWWMAPLLFVVEFLGTFIVRPYSLTLRLTGNMFGDHTVFGIMSDLVPLVVPAALLGLGILVSVIQAFVFSLLSTVYVALAIAPMDEHH